MYDNISLGDLRTWNKNTIHGVLQAFPLVLSFLDANSCSFVWIYAVMPCFFSFFHFFGLVLGKIVPTDCVFCFVLLFCFWHADMP